jgi:hypothetical protein
MGVLGKIISTIFGHANAAPAAPPGAPSGSASGSSAAAPSPTAKTSGPTGTPAAPVDVAAILTKLAASNKERLDWQKSIVDLMKLLNLDSSLAARKELADELHATPEGAGGRGNHARSMGELEEAFPGVGRQGLDLD